MSFCKQRVRAFTWLICTAQIIALNACDRANSREQKALQTELRQALSEHSYSKATELARRMLRSNPQDEGKWNLLVQAQLGMHDFTGATQTLEEWRRVIAKPSADRDEYTGDLALERHDSALAAQAWTTALGADPKNTRVLEKIALLESREHHWDKANAAWTTHLEIQDNALARVNRALCRRRLHRWQDAFDDLYRAQELAPDDSEVLRVGKLFEQIARFLADIRELDAALAVSPNDPQLLGDRALMFLRSGDYELALEAGEEAIKFGPWAVRPKLLQSVALIDLGRPEECERLGVLKLIRLETLTPEFLETIGRLDSEISVEQRDAELYVARAWQLNEIGQPELALQDAESAARLNPRSASANAEWSYALRKLGCAGEALEQIKHATELDPTFSTAWQYRGELEMELGETLSAIESLSRAIETTHTVVALEKREQCYRRLGLLVKAEQDRRTLEHYGARVAK